ncbi:uncharacterized protein LOC131698874 [Acipenser ruthenus]|uniref:uncharacterized protein LOC131698874 n=1 Tax=Acipenser ruthenus TaxID=7906 RepID=UPI0027404B25|nr:uncharacterized protein LOC131698874 [Acipenser ruthenus]
MVLNGWVLLGLSARCEQRRALDLLLALLGGTHMLSAALPLILFSCVQLGGNKPASPAALPVQPAQGSSALDREPLQSLRLHILLPDAGNLLHSLLCLLSPDVDGEVAGELPSLEPTEAGMAGHAGRLDSCLHPGHIALAGLAHPRAALLPGGHLPLQPRAHRPGLRAVPAPAGGRGHCHGTVLLHAHSYRDDLQGAPPRR